jgi:hypothetical protein
MKGPVTKSSTRQMAAIPMAVAGLCNARSGQESRTPRTLVVFIFIEKIKISNGGGKQFPPRFVLFSGNYTRLQGLSNVGFSALVKTWMPHCPH